MQGMAQYGRNGDTMMAHVAPGEMVVPQEVLQQRPQVARGLGMAFRDVGADPLRYVVGSKRNSMNPITGEPEFFLDKIIGAVTGGGFFSNPIVQGAIGNVLAQTLGGKKPSLRDALIGGVAGGGLSYLGGGDSGLGALFGADVDAPSVAKAAGVSPFSAGQPKVSAIEALSGAAAKPPAPVARAEGLLGIGEMFNTDTSSGLGRILNTKIGESLAMGLGAQLLDSVFGSNDEEEDISRTKDRSYAEIMADPDRIRFNRLDRPMNLNKGGATYFPRRDGGIMPSEGSGTKDDVPAMLTAGEFVMTRDAVKGAGNGNLNKGINKMYGMMDKLEGMA